MGRKYAHLPAAPFVELLHREEQLIGTAALATDIEVDERTLYRYRHSLDGDGRPTDSFPKDHIENALWKLRVELADLYPDLEGDDAEIVEGWCSVCEEIVGIDKEQRCLWCCTPAGKPMSRRERAQRAGTICSDCGGKKSAGGALICRPCYDKDPHPVPSNKIKTAKPCPLCGGPKASHAMRCVKCYRGLRLDTGKRKPMHMVKITDDDLMLAWELYDEHGHSVREVTEFLDHDYASQHAAEHAILMAWRARGLHTRPQGETRQIVEARWRYVRGQLPAGKRSGSMGRAKR